jgi:hypothetical protein
MKLRQKDLQNLTTTLIRSGIRGVVYLPTLTPEQLAERYERAGREGKLTRGTTPDGRRTTYCLPGCIGYLRPGDLKRVYEILHEDTLSHLSVNEVTIYQVAERFGLNGSDAEELAMYAAEHGEIRIITTGNEVDGPEEVCDGPERGGTAHSLYAEWLEDHGAVPAQQAAPRGVKSHRPMRT